ncbi:TetR/AcrR family transcriptional regulator [Streptomyces sp. NRRL F-5126]|uniref:TetR/AcrR family transcriptional regulator n=1 Tax=Streptomyces sp. NRRL F-5126 TaxID=1463857 RepID=UPI0004C89573|nr:TetR/AcrR family transcriptional regulator [Streptomyces sp. NRRL F-5126]
MRSEQPSLAPRAPRTQEQRRAQTRAALLAAAAELVVESGVRALTLARVGERAGYSRGIVTHHFGSKQAMFEALAKSSQSGFVPGIGDMPPGLERLVALADGYVRELGRDDVAGRAFLLLWAESATAPELSLIFRERDEAFRADLRADVTAGVADGTIRADSDPGDVAAAVLGQLRGIGLQRLLDPAAVDAQRLGRALAVQWRRALSA